MEEAPKRGAVAMNLLIVDDEETTRELCLAVAHQAGLNATAVASAEEALEVAELSAVDIVLTDLKLPKAGGLELLRTLRELHPQTAVIVLTQYGSIDSAIEATKQGALDYVTKPFRIEELRTRLEKAIHEVDLRQENRLLRDQLTNGQPGFGKLIGLSPKMQRVYKTIEKVSGHEYPVLILGESGTGKELVARSLHMLGSRKEGPFVPVDCSSLVPTLIESELFGYVKGAFTGAMQSKVGLLEAANGGTVFLDEIGDMPTDLQARLLRALQEKEIKPVGSTERRKINVRIIAATNRDLEAAIRAGTFRQDLYFRLNVVQVKLPPLRDRKTDIPLLVTSFLEKYSPVDEPVRAISADTMQRLMAYDWPGNVRELENCIERAVAMSSGPMIHTADLPSNLQYSTSERAPQRDELLPLEELERRAILRTLRETNGDKLSAARMLGIGKTTLYRKLKQYKLERAEEA
ncbi:MAG: sigma-54-dependent Fis family transcriptional regulator [Acidobacteria bacterium]|nr:sigma-54-dependent Fis family transcriptional regulator [Acidobacteriota bacterium]MBS1867063.1 sigma-54-dependent Fis family transcriptional regulator [Acidobacteriota bacterium]